MDANPTEPIKPIETSYKGHRFRSRLEARWAVWFDHLGIEWLYEPERFPVGNSTYLPDFWLPEHHCWAEVKGILDASVLDLLVAAADPNGGLPADPTGRRWTSGDPAGRLLLLGPVPDVRSDAWIHTRFDYRDAAVVQSTVTFRHITPLGPDAKECADAVLWREPTRRESGYWPSLKVLLSGRPDSWLRPDPVVRDAYRAARAARFEYGESGAPQKLAEGPVRLDTPAERAGQPLAVLRSGTPMPVELTTPVRRRRPREDESRLPWFKPLWPKVVESVRGSDPVLADVLSRARVFKVVKQTVTLVFEGRADCQDAENAIEEIRAAIIAVTGRKPWGVKCKLATKQHGYDGGSVITAA